MLDNRNSYTWSADVLDRNRRLLARDVARVMREVATTRHHIARSLERLADRSPGGRASELRLHARRLDELAARAMRFAEAEQQEASPD